MPLIGLTLGPLFFNWSADQLKNFYNRIADEAPMERVHVGEVVRGKRIPFSDQVWPVIIERLERGGKEVVLSTLAAPSTLRELRAIEELCADGRLVEINDVTALSAYSGRRVVAGPLLNVYNEATALCLIRQGALTICPPVEMSLATVGAIATTCREAEFEFFAFGQLPLGLAERFPVSPRAQHTNSCQPRYERDRNLLTVDTLDNERFLAIDGVLTPSAQVQAVLRDPAEFAARGIGRLRLSPHGGDMVEVTRIYRELVEHRLDPDHARFLLSCLDLPGTLVDGNATGMPRSRIHKPARNHLI